MENEQGLKFYTVAEVSKMLEFSRTRTYNFAKGYENFEDCTTEEK